MNDTIKQQTLAMLVKHTGLNASELADDKPLDQIHIHEFIWLELLYEIEDTFEIEFPASVWLNGFSKEFKTVGNMLITVSDLYLKKSHAA